MPERLSGDLSGSQGAPVLGHHRGWRRALSDRPPGSGCDAIVDASRRLGLTMLIALAMVELPAGPSRSVRRSWSTSRMPSGRAIAREPRTRTPCAGISLPAPAMSFAQNEPNWRLACRGGKAHGPRWGLCITASESATRGQSYGTDPAARSRLPTNEQETPCACVHGHRSARRRVGSPIPGRRHQ